MSERGKRHRIFIYGEISPGEIEKLFQFRRVNFDSAYVSNWERVFRCDPAKSSVGLATLLPKEKAVTFGYYFNCNVTDIDSFDRFMGVDKGIRVKHPILMGFGDGEVGSAHTYMTSYKNFGWPEQSSLKKMSDWMNTFWPTVDYKITWRDISIR